MGFLDFCYSRAKSRPLTKNTKMFAIIIFIPISDVPSFLLPPANTTANLSHSATIQCRTSAREAPSIRWYTSDNNGNRLREIGHGNLPAFVRGGTTFVTVEGDLEFTEAREIDEGWYTCVAENNVGRVERAAYLMVNGKAGEFSNFYPSKS